MLDKVLQSGQCFGEVALITKAPRNATIIASEDVKCGGNKYADFVFSGTFHIEPNYYFEINKNSSSCHSYPFLENNIMIHVFKLVKTRTILNLIYSEHVSVTSIFGFFLKNFS